MTPLDMPNEAGWWAFKGDQVIVSRHPTEVVKNIVEWEPDAEHPYYRFSDERWPSQLKEAWFREQWDGKWYRIYMPWEQQPAPTEPGRYFFDGYRTNSSGNRARVQGWLDWPDDDGAMYEGRWQPDTRLICEKCNDYLEHPSYCEMCYAEMESLATM